MEGPAFNIQPKFSFNLASSTARLPMLVDKDINVKQFVYHRQASQFTPSDSPHRIAAPNCSQNAVGYLANVALPSSESVPVPHVLWPFNLFMVGNTSPVPTLCQAQSRQFSHRGACRPIGLRQHLHPYALHPEVLLRTTAEHPGTHDAHRGTPLGRERAARSASGRMPS